MPDLESALGLISGVMYNLRALARKRVPADASQQVVQEL